MWVPGDGDGNWGAEWALRGRGNAMSNAATNFHFVAEAMTTPCK